MFKLALDAGHAKNTAGKRCLKSLDKNETREWVLNSRIAEKIQKYLSGYEGIAIKRMDDATGKNDINTDARAKTANKWGATLYLSLHHDSGIKGGTGGGLTTFRLVGLSDTGDTAKIQKKFYNALIKAGVPKGDRAEAIRTEDFEVLRETTMPAVLIEFGFMDSATDIKYILTDEFADIAAKGCVNTIVELGKLKKKKQETPVVSQPVEEKPDESLKDEPIEVKQPEAEPKSEITTEEVQPTPKENEEIVSDNSIIEEETQKTENTLITLIKFIVELIKKYLTRRNNLWKF